MSQNYLIHHGIEGQKWGQRNGPPYPLEASDHSSSEKKAGKKGWSKEVKQTVTSDGKLTEYGKKRYTDTSYGGRLGNGLWKIIGKKVTKGYKNMSDDGIITDMQSTHYGSDFTKTTEGKKLHAEFTKAYDKYFDTENPSKEIEKAFVEAEEKYLKAEYKYIADSMLNRYGEELMSLYYTEGKSLDKGKEAVNDIINEWKYHTI